MIIILFIYSAFIEPSILIVKNINFRDNKIKNNLKIVLFSDTHFNAFYGEYQMQKIVEKINAENPDIIIFSGDLMDSYSSSPPNTTYIIEHLKNLNAKIAKYSIYGNHDYGGKAEKVYKDIMEDSGFELLKNQIKFNDDVGICIVGIDDYIFGKPNKSILNETNENYYNILITHEPDLVDKLNIDNVNLILSGHTHGGQVKIPFITKYVLPYGGRNYVDGLYSFENKIKTKLYVTTGIGLSQIRLRFLNPPEIIVFNINK